MGSSYPTFPYFVKQLKCLQFMLMQSAQKWSFYSLSYTSLLRGDSICDKKAKVIYLVQSGWDKVIDEANISEIVRVRQISITFRFPYKSTNGSFLIT